MIGSGIFKEQVDGKEVCFQFGTLAGCYTEEKSGVSIFELFQQIQNKPAKATRLLLYYFWGGAVAYAEINNINEKPSIAEVSVWLDHIGITRLFQIYLESVKSPASKNGQAPKEAGLVDV